MKRRNVTLRTLSPAKLRFVTVPDTFPKRGVTPGKEVRMESVIAALVTGVLTLVGVLVSNSRSRVVMEAKIDALTKQVEKHNCLVERTYVLERDMAVVRNDIDSLKREEK